MLSRQEHELLAYHLNAAHKIAWRGWRGPQKRSVQKLWHRIVRCLDKAKCKGDDMIFLDLREGLSAEERGELNFVYYPGQRPERYVTHPIEIPCAEHKPSG